MAKVLGIDPGAKGGVAVVADGRVIVAADMPTVTDKGKARVDPAGLASLLRSFGPVDEAIIERVGAMPGQGVSSMFTFGKAAGIAIGVVSALGIPVTEIVPAKWKADLRVPANKDGARSRASQLLPSGASYWPLVKHDGRAEAALLALWGQKHAAPIEW